MVVIRYDDEDGPITWTNAEDRALWEAVKFSSGLTFREICAVATALILSEIDPIDATDGPVFEWPTPPRDPDLCWISPKVPGPLANVNVLEAFRHAQRDACACRMTLEHDNSTEALAKVLRNTIGWLNFWKIRAKTLELRGWYAQQLELRMASLMELRERAFAKSNDEMIEALAEI